MWYLSRMAHLRIFLSALLFVFVSLLSPVRSLAQNPAPTPPMGWNSWDAYGLTINEADFKANAAVLAQYKQYGWQYAVVDEGWYMENPFGEHLADKKYLLDENGILIPVVSRFPSSADNAGFKPLADWVHQQGLKFGIHIVRGIPKQAVEKNLPVAGTAFHATDAADKNSPCGWDEGNWGVADNAAGQAYYDSMLKLYAGWGLDYIKVDCISDHPYRPTEIKQIAVAIKKTGRPIVLSLSPGPTQLEHAAEIGEYAQMWRITNDHWDGWKLPSKPEWDEFPFGLGGEFDRIAKWYTYVKPGNWPDADMLPWGSLTPHPGWGEPRQSGLTQEEEKTELNLWSISRSPLILGANLTKLDDFLRGLLANQSILFINQNATYSHPVDVAGLGAGFANARVWRATINEPGARNYAEFFGFFNLDDKPATLRANWKQLGLEGSKHKAQNLWSNDGFKESKEVSVTLPAHGSTIFEIR